MFEISIDVVAAAAVALLAVQSQKKVEFQQLWRIVLLSNGHHAKSVDPRIQMINFRRRYHSVQVPERLQRRCCRHVIAFVTVLSSLAGAWSFGLERSHRSGMKAMANKWAGKKGRYHGCGVDALANGWAGSMEW